MKKIMDCCKRRKGHDDIYDGNVGEIDGKLYIELNMKNGLRASPHFIRVNGNFQMCQSLQDCLSIFEKVRTW